MQTEPMIEVRSPRPARVALGLNTPVAEWIACVLVPVLCGLYSLWLGADADWDLANYHIYNPFALLNGRFNQDFGAAGMQTYFNPLLDVPIYWIHMHLPSRLGGFLLGVFHGLTFVMVLALAKRTVPALPERDRIRVPLLLAIAGTLSASNVTGIGNSMGDITTALFIYAGLLVMLARWDRLSARGAGAVLTLIASGVLVGAGAGLKLTTAVSAVAACAALLVYPASLLTRIRLCFVFGIGVLLGFAATGGYWMLFMWQTFRNPVFPQFSTIFPNPLGAPITVGDARWGTKGVLEALLWPFIFSAHPVRISDLIIYQIIWPLAYIVFWVGVVVEIAARLRRRTLTQIDSRAWFVLLYVVIGYIVWMKAFSIYRYLVAVEVLLPIAVFVMLVRMLPYPSARRVALWILGASTLMNIGTGLTRSWGHEAWDDPLYRAEVPAIAQPAKTTVVLYVEQSAWAWLAPLFPSEVAFTQIENAYFVGTPAYAERVRNLVASRGGQAYAIIDGAKQWRARSLDARNDMLRSVGLLQSASGCAFVQRALNTLHLHERVEPVSSGGDQCKLVPLDEDKVTAADANRMFAEQAVAPYARSGFTLDPATCKPYQSWIGKGLIVYQWCPLTMR
ncbi:hypothetical protein [Pararobbsia silviterrae]|uniref:DUF2029 domain-containing protein n=1 Tax=Pararobbsia silviterrae TaxID=1792498 RepID=A0A494Y8N5_9BURK|nr:hypothetical protein [Pararobbsia silviterrae]RKP59039.1 hypothetical protein D7S86_03765 [Pararobbsia silviterrae]